MLPGLPVQEAHPLPTVTGSPWARVRAHTHTRNVSLITVCLPVGCKLCEFRVTAYLPPVTRRVSGTQMYVINTLMKDHGFKPSCIYTMDYGADQIK